MNLDTFIDHLAKHHWTDYEIKKYIGPYQGAYFGYSKDHMVRSNAASGGMATAILIDMLSSGKIDGALVCMTRVENNSVRAGYAVATTRDELISAQGSKYISGKFSSEAMTLIRQFDGRLAVVALPCDAKLLHSVCAHNEAIRKKIALIITLFCGHLSRPELTDTVIKKITHSADEELKSFRYRSGAWRGSLMLEMADGKVIRKRFSKFSNYQNLYYFCERKCLSCYDHIGFFGDVAVGDVWLQKMKSESIKHSCVIVKTDKGRRVVEDLLQGGKAALTSVPITTAMDAQTRSLRIHCNISPRAAMAKKYGLRIDDPNPEKFNIFQRMVAKVILRNALLTQTMAGAEKVRQMSNLSLKTQLYFFKLLQLL